MYVVECADGSYYTGITNDLERRLREHNAGTGGSYTRSFGPVRLLWREAHPSRSSASKREARIKRLERPAKEALVRGAGS